MQVHPLELADGFNGLPFDSMKIHVESMGRISVSYWLGSKRVATRRFTGVYPSDDLGVVINLGVEGKIKLEARD